MIAIALGLLLLDVALLLVHASSARLGASHLDPAWLIVHPFRVDADRGVAEVVQYLKLGLLACAAFVLLRRGHHMMLVFAALFTVLLLDDALQAHEQFGSLLADRLALPSLAGLPPYDVGELLVWLLVGGVLLTVLLTMWRSQVPGERRIVVALTAFIAALAFFGVGVDAVAAVAQNEALLSLTEAVVEAVPRFLAGLTISPLGSLPGALTVPAALAELLAGESIALALTELRSTKVAWTLIEEGGEMILLTLMVTYLSGLLLSRRAVSEARAAADLLPVSPTPGRHSRHG